MSGTGPNTAVTAIGAFGKAPKVTIPKALPGSSLTVKTLIQGTGSAVTKADAVAANFVLYFWQGKSSSLKASTYTSSPTVIGGQMLPGLETALVGKKVGSRVLAVIPPAQGYGTAGQLADRRDRQHLAGVRHRRGEVLRRHRRGDRHAGVQRRRQPADRQRQGGHRADRCPSRPPRRPARW